jgi:hypothetical protein
LTSLELGSLCVPTWHLDSLVQLVLGFMEFGLESVVRGGWPLAWHGKSCLAAGDIYIGAT